MTQHFHFILAEHYFRAPAPVTLVGQADADVVAGAMGNLNLEGEKSIATSRHRSYGHGR